MSRNRERTRRPQALERSDLDHLIEDLRHPDSRYIFIDGGPFQRPPLYGGHCIVHIGVAPPHAKQTAETMLLRANLKQTDLWLVDDCDSSHRSSQRSLQSKLQKAPNVPGGSEEPHKH